MKKKKVFMFLIQFILLAFIGFTIYGYVQNQVKPQDVFVFYRELPVNTKITEDDLAVRTIPGDAVAKDFVLNPDDIVGKYTSAKVYPGQFVIDKLTVTLEETDPFESMDLSKLRKVSLPINYVDGFAGNIKKGDKVDLIFTGKGKVEKEDGSGDDEFFYSKVFLQDVLVYSVTTADGFKFDDHSTYSKNEVTYSDSEQISTSSESEELAVVTLAVTLEQSEEIATRVKGGQVKLVGRFAGNVNYETLGFVLGQYGNIFSGEANVEVNERIDIPVKSIEENKDLSKTEAP